MYSEYVNDKLTIYWSLIKGNSTSKPWELIKLFYKLKKTWEYSVSYSLMRMHIINNPSVLSCSHFIFIKCSIDCCEQCTVIAVQIVRLIFHILQKYICCLVNLSLTYILWSDLLEFENMIFVGTYYKFTQEILRFM